MVCVVHGPPCVRRHTLLHVGLMTDSSIPSLPSRVCLSPRPTSPPRSSKRATQGHAAKKLADEVQPKRRKTNHKTATTEGSREHLPHLAMN